MRPYPLISANIISARSYFRCPYNFRTVSVFEFTIWVGLGWALVGLFSANALVPSY